MTKYPHTLTCKKAETGDLITYYCKIKVDGFNYVTEISYHSREERSAFSILRILAESKHQLMYEIYRIARLCRM